MTITHPDFPAYGLGRNLRHDAASRQYVTRFSDAVTGTRMHRHYGPILDQGSLGSCTGNAAAQALNTAPLHALGMGLYGESEAVAFYSDATHLDGNPDAYPPDDTGADGLSVAKALLRRGLITRYEHAFGLSQALATVSQHPVITGVPWYEGMFKPDSRGFVNVSGRIVGGHEFLVRGIDVQRRYVQAVNSWGKGWGVNGEFRMTFDTWGELLAQDGDVTILIRE